MSESLMDIEYVNGMDKKRAAELLPPRQENSNKGTYGKTLIIAGCDDMPGSAMLCSRSALRCGVGVAYLYASKKVRTRAVSYTPEIVTLPEEGKLDLSLYSSVVIGPGLSKSEKAVEKVDAIDKNYEGVVVYDADALNILAAKMADEGVFGIDKVCAWLNDRLPKNSVLTPHRKEFDRLMGEMMYGKKIATAPRELSKRSLHTWVLKDYFTTVVSPGKNYDNNTGNNGMSTAGSGDVLAGMLGGLMASFAKNKVTVERRHELACLGVYLHGLAGNIARDKYTEYSMLAHDISDNISEAIKSLLVGGKA